MSKSIYDEVLEIIDKNIFELPDGFAVLYEIRKKIQQAKKQERLLNLYRKLITIKDEATSIVWLDAEMEAEVIELEKQIEELENE